MRIVVMGVAASGKTTVGQRLAEALGLRFVDADDAHPQANVDKMSAGVPLDDTDRWPWLASLTRTLADATATDGVVVTCSALKRSYRDQLRWAGDVRFVHLDVDRDEVIRRIEARTDHFMPPSMVDSQFDALEAPGDDELDVLVVQADEAAHAVVAAISAELSSIDLTGAAPLLSVGSSEHSVGPAELQKHIDQLLESQVIAPGLRRVLLVPPDHTRLHSRAGAITAHMFTRLTDAAIDTWVLPALGTHNAMGPDELGLMFGDSIPADRVLVHDWRDGLTELGEISSTEVAAASDGRFMQSIPVAVSSVLDDDWDLVISVGQVVPHEVIGMANYTKNIVIGLGGAPTIHRSHQLGAVCDMETIMGQVTTPVRQIIDTAFDRFVATRVPTLFVLTVMQDTDDGVVQRGLFAGHGAGVDSAGAAFRQAASLARSVNITPVSTPFRRLSCWLDPDEFHSTWLGNKAVYRTRMAMADDGELLVLAPGVVRFGEDPEIDRLIRQHGYHGTPTTLAALRTDPELEANLSAAAHLIHGSSEGRFQITYCTDPDAGGLTQAEVESVGFGWRSLTQVIDELGIDGTSLSGSHLDRDGQSFDHISNPALGLWSASVT